MKDKIENLVRVRIKALQENLENSSDDKSCSIAYSNLLNATGALSQIAPRHKLLKKSREIRNKYLFREFGV